MWKILWRFLLPLSLLVFANIMYGVSLRGWPYRPMKRPQWAKWLQENALFFTITTLVCWFAFFVIIILIYHNVLQRKWIIAIGINFWGIWFYKTGGDFDDHGIYNIIFVVGTDMILLTLYFIIILMIYIYRKGCIYIMISKIFWFNLV